MYVKITADNVTDEQIEALRAEAATYGDVAMVDLCDAALTEIDCYEVRSARIKCAIAIENARIRYEEENA